jgi:ABC-type nickel/cobalt efflux system permease component RcnA
MTAASEHTLRDPPAATSSRSSRIVDNAKKHGLAVATVGGTSAIGGITAIAELLERTARIQSALGLQIGAVAVVVIVLVALYLSRQEARDRAQADERDRSRAAYIEAWERRDEATQASFYTVIAEMKEAQFHVARRVDNLSEKFDALRDEVVRRGIR